MLVDHSDAGSNRIGWRAPAHGSSMHQDSTGVRTCHSERDPHECGLASAVLSEECVYSSWSRGEAGSVQCVDSTEALDDADNRNRSCRRLQDRTSHVMMTLYQRYRAALLEACRGLKEYPRQAEAVLKMLG
jgi:hypothetical protein